MATQAEELKQRSGRVGFAFLNAWSVYSATAGAISGLFPALAVELAPR